MKKIGLIGGVGWPSTLDYYRSINELANAKLGSLISPEILVYSLNFDEIVHFQHAGEWSKTVPILTDAALSLQRAGADFLLICSVTTNIAFREVQRNITIPILNIADAVGEKIVEAEITKVGLLGTKATMGYPFFTTELSRYGLEVLTPTLDEQEIINRIIYEELCLNRVEAQSKKEYCAIVEKLRNRGAQGIILGCTEIPMLINQSDFNIPIFNAALLHAQKAFEMSVLTAPASTPLNDFQ